MDKHTPLSLEGKPKLKEFSSKSVKDPLEKRVEGTQWMAEVGPRVPAGTGKCFTGKDR